MSGVPRERASSVSELREAFDHAFAAPPSADRVASENILGIRAGGGAYALLLSEISAVDRCGTILRIPSKARGLCGVVGIEGRVVPVFSLALLLGYPSDENVEWLVLCDAKAPVALAFSKLDGYFQVPAASVPSTSATLGSGRHLGGTVRLGDTAATLIHVQTLIAEIKGAAPSAPLEAGALTIKG
jgi:chemotaxis signal transduction protein